MTGCFTKPDKVYMENTNLMYALAPIKKGYLSVRERLPPSFDSELIDIREEALMGSLSCFCNVTPVLLIMFFYIFFTISKKKTIFAFTLLQKGDVNLTCKILLQK